MVRGELKRVRRLWIKAIPTRGSRTLRCRSRERLMAQEITENGVHKNWDNNKARVIQEFLSTKREYAKKRGVTKLVAPQCVACSTEGKKEFLFSLQKEMRDFASKTYEKAKRSSPCKLGRNPKKKEKLPNRQLLKYVQFIYSTHDSLIIVRIILIK